MKNLKLKAARAEKDLSQKQLAELAGVSRATIEGLESGKSNPSLYVCKKICQVLGKGLDDIFGESKS